jgi:hypothetical protein
LQFASIGGKKVLWGAMKNHLNKKEVTEKDVKDKCVNDEVVKYF